MRGDSWQRVDDLLHSSQVSRKVALRKVLFAIGKQQYDLDPGVPADAVAIRVLGEVRAEVLQDFRDAGGDDRLFSAKG